MDDRLASLMAAVVDVIDVAGKIIAKPFRQAPSATVTEIVALALAFEAAWAVALEADVLARASDLPPGDARDLAIATQADEIKRLMSAIRGEPSKGEPA